jgi:hypothetical protein
MIQSTAPGAFPPLSFTKNEWSVSVWPAAIAGPETVWGAANCCARKLSEAGRQTDGHCCPIQ